MTARWIAGAAAGLALLATAPLAGAYYGNGAELLSADYARGEQGDDATLYADLSADGRYAAMQTRARNFFADDDPDPPGRYREGGIFRRDIDGRGVLPLVASGDVRSESTGALVSRGAANPSISADGRFVAFSTAQALVPADTNGAIDVYVRDMSVPVTASGAFDLVSARDGSDGAASYVPRSQQPNPGLDPGSEVSRGTAISDDGRYVVFRTTAASSLPDAISPSTPAGQLFVRDRSANITRLVTRQSGTQTPAGGALGASISGDGSTVAWTGRSAVDQTRFQPGETLSDFPYYLWQRWSDGSSAPTRRVTGQVDVDDPSCASGTTVEDSPTAVGPCYGPLTSAENRLSANISSFVPALDSHGDEVAFLTGAGPRPNAQTPEGLDLWITSMAPGATRKSSSTELTRESTPSDAGLEGLTLSDDGRFLAFTTYRNVFRLPVLSAVGDFRAQPDQRELFVADLAARTLERAVRSVSGADSSGSVDAAPSISADGSRIAFTSGTPDLFFGDANQRPDAFAVTRQPEPPAEAPPPPESSGVADKLTVSAPSRGRPRLAVRAKALSGGVLEVRTTAPAAGTIKVTAKASVGVGKRRRTATLVTASKRSTKRATVVLRIRPVRRYRGELRKRKKLVARLTVGYVASQSNRRLSGSVRATFVEKIPAKRKKR